MTEIDSLQQRVDAIRNSGDAVVDDQLPFLTRTSIKDICIAEGLSPDAE